MSSAEWGEITASGEIECTECGHVIESGHTPKGCTMCDCRVGWTVRQKYTLRAMCGLPREWRD